MNVKNLAAIALLSGGILIAGAMVYYKGYTNLRNNLPANSQAVVIIPTANNGGMGNGARAASTRRSARQQPRADEMMGEVSLTPMPSRLGAASSSRYAGSGTGGGSSQSMYRPKADTHGDGGGGSFLLATASSSSKSKGEHSSGGGGGALSVSGRAAAKPFAANQPLNAPVATANPDDPDDGLPPPEGAPVGGGGFVLAALAAGYALLRKGGWLRASR